jgi:enolase-phosphatase E1
MIWEDGYREGAFKAHLYPDAHDWIELRHAEGLPLYIYSSGSRQAQALYFAYNEFGDLRSRFQGHFDTTVGSKKEAGSYVRIAEKIGMAPGEIAFFSDIADELEAAQAAGMPVVQLVRAGTRPDPRFSQAPDFTGIELEKP